MSNLICWYSFISNFCIQLKSHVLPILHTLLGCGCSQQLPNGFSSCDFLDWQLKSGKYVISFCTTFFYIRKEKYLVFTWCPCDQRTYLKSILRNCVLKILWRCLASVNDLIVTFPISTLEVMTMGPFG